MRDVFIDTGGWASFFLRTQRHHARAAGLMAQWQRGERRVVTSNYVLAELVALFLSPLRLPHPISVHYVDTIKSASWVELVHIDAATDAAAWNLLKSRQDKEWSLVDCASFVVMRQRGLTEALATDHNFEQAGFVQLLKP